MASQDKKPVIKQESQSQDKSRRQGGGQRRNQGPRRAPNTSAKFKGKTEDLEGHIYNVGVSNQAHLFATTTKEISEYAGRNLKESQDIRLAIEKVEDVTFTIPTKHALGGGLDTTAVDIIYKTKLDGYIKRESIYRQNKSLMYAVVFGQCAEPMRAKIEGDGRFENIKQSSNVVA